MRYELVDEIVKCGFCNKEFNPMKDLKDNLSKREYCISKLCQKCQDEVFG